MKNRLADAVHKKRERQRIDKNVDIFFSMPCQADTNHVKEVNNESSNDGDDEDIVSTVNSSPSVRQIQKQRSKRLTATAQNIDQGRDKES